MDVEKCRRERARRRLGLKARRGPPVPVNGVVMGELLDERARLIAVKPPR